MTDDTDGLSSPPTPTTEAAQLLRLVQQNAAARHVLDWMLRWHGDGKSWVFSTPEIAAATGLRETLVLGALTTLCGLRLVTMAYRGRKARLEVARIARQLAHPERPIPSPMFTPEVPEAYRGPHKPDAADGRALLAQDRPTPDDVLAGLITKRLDRVERDLRSIEEADDDDFPPEGDHDDSD